MLPGVGSANGLSPDSSTLGASPENFVHHAQMSIRVQRHAVWGVQRAGHHPTLDGGHFP